MSVQALAGTVVSPWFLLDEKRLSSPGQAALEAGSPVLVSAP